MESMSWAHAALRSPAPSLRCNANSDVKLHEKSFLRGLKTEKMKLAVKPSKIPFPRFLSFLRLVLSSPPVCRTVHPPDPKRRETYF